MKKKRRQIPWEYFEEKLSFLLASSPVNVYWLTGFRSSSSMVLLSRDGDGFFITDKRYEERARALEDSYKVIISTGGFVKPLLKLVKNRYLQIDTEEISAKDYISIASKVKNVREWPGFFRKMRARKDEDEIKFLKDAYKRHRSLLDKFLHLLSSSAGKITERECVQELKVMMLEEGFEDFSFDPMVLQGKNSSTPHGESTDAVIDLSEPILLDFGGKINLWNTDETVMIYPEKLKNKEKFLKIHKILQDGMEMIGEKIKGGVRAKKIDRLMRDYLKKFGLDSHFTHGLGHGIGLEIHERPVLSPVSRDYLEEGMVFTIEPGLYFENEWGIRLESTFAILNGEIVEISCIKKDPIFI